MVWAIDHAIAVHEVAADEPVMFIGPTRAGAMIEVGVTDAGVIIHAMPARPKFLPK